MTTAAGFRFTEARVGHNTELGTPTDKDPSDDIIISRRHYTFRTTRAMAIRTG